MLVAQVGPLRCWWDLGTVAPGFLSVNEEKALVVRLNDLRECVPCSEVWLNERVISEVRLH